jgi:hypothetical protein
MAAGRRVGRRVGRVPVPVRLVLVLAVAAIGGTLFAYRPSLDPPGLTPRGLEFAVATGDVLVDSPTSILGDITQEAGRPPRMALRLVQYLKTGSATERIARYAGVPLTETVTSGPFTTLVGRDNDFSGQRRGALPRELPKTADRYRVVIDVADNRPLLTIYTEAPDPATATALLTATKRTLRDAVESVRRPDDPSQAEFLVLTDEGTVPGHMVDAGAQRSLAFLVFAGIAALGSWLVARRRRRVAAPPPGSRRSPPQPGGDWPHTRRILPWSLAAFLVMLWTVPFDALRLPINIPLDGKLDRPAMVGLVGIWGLTLLTAPRSLRPRIRFTPIHVAMAVLLAFCAGSVALNVDALASMGEVGLVVKKLAVLITYMLLFVVVASVLRPREVPRFALLMVALGGLAGLGSLIEYRFSFNLFYGIAQALPGIDVSPPGDLYKADSIGRLTIYGPSGHPLELATMLGLALPFAIVGLTEANTRRRTLLYGLAAAVLLGGAFATLRKTSMIAPLVGLLVLVAYQPRVTLRKLVPLFAVIFVLVHFAAPGAIGSTAGQLLPGRVTGVLSTQDRTSDYDGVRPDVTRHLVLGRGYESYEPHRYRILDNQYLGLLVGIGVAGVVAYLAFIVASMRAGHRALRGRDPARRPTALAAIAGMAVLGVATGLFDLLSFPHVSYLLFFLAGMLAVLSDPAGAPAVAPSRRRATYETRPAQPAATQAAVSAAR